MDRTCRGVQPSFGASCEAEFARDVLGAIPTYTVDEQERLSRQAQADFDRALLENSHAPDWNVDDSLQKALGTPWLVSGPAWSAAWQPFEAGSPGQGPLYLGPDLKWRTFRLEGDTLVVLGIGADGQPESPGPTLDVPHAAPRPAPGLERVLQRVVRREVFAGQVFHAVAGSDFSLRVPAATKIRLEQVRADLLARQVLLSHLGFMGEALAEEVDRFYDAAFLDHPTLGPWL